MFEFSRLQNNRTILFFFIEWCFTPLSTVFQSCHGDSSHYSCLSWVSPVLGWALKCLAKGNSCEKNPEGTVRLEPRTPGLRVKHFTTETRGTLLNYFRCNTVEFLQGLGIHFENLGVLE